MKRFLFSIIFVSSLMFVACQNPSITQTKKIKINDQIINVEIAETISQMTKGLGGRQDLKDDQGMLFKYSDKQIRNFHMKDMLFSLDIVWINDDLIVGLAENVPVYTVNGQISKVESPLPVNQVLEVPAGWAAKNGVKIGDLVISLD